ncbi:hypothetical protein LCGC14_0959620 [marine sediment metagenome]|uniref:Uncharacterized protein n=1 Tax=marine sediment metagenome TaxID=412755 RepID=A0A0F9RLB5_9ZZZZ
MSRQRFVELAADMIAGAGTKTITITDLPPGGGLRMAILTTNGDGDNTILSKHWERESGAYVNGMFKIVYTSQDTWRIVDWPIVADRMQFILTNRLGSGRNYIIYYIVYDAKDAGQLNYGGLIHEDDYPGIAASGVQVGTFIKLTWGTRISIMVAVAGVPNGKIYYIDRQTYGGDIPVLAWGVSGNGGFAEFTSPCSLISWRIYNLDAVNTMDIQIYTTVIG